MNQNPRIVVFGSVHMDLIAHAAVLPDKGSSVIGHDFDMRPGGKAGNQAVQCARNGADVCMVTQLGDDQFGRELLQSLRSRSVDCSEVNLAQGLKTGASTVLSAPEGYTSIIYLGAASAMTPDDVRSRVNRLVPFDVLLLQLELPVALSLAAAQAAKSCGACVVLNASPARSGIEDLLALSSIVVVNESEAEALAGTGDVRAVAAFSGGSAVVTRGENGADASDGVHVWRQAAVPVRVQSTVGAGDAFLAGLCVAMCGGTIEGALGFAVTAAARHLSTQ